MCVFSCTGCRLGLLLLSHLGEALVIICSVCLFVCFEGTLLILSQGMVKKVIVGKFADFIMSGDTKINIISWNVRG